ncbi:saccharopine dehydrogenase [Planctomycetales bacterium]|nr:saccharopine dehydrogenase [Planctomycetales bacterium]
MDKVLIIGAGGVGRVVAFKCAQHPEVFKHIAFASKTKSKCDAIAADIKTKTGRSDINTAKIDAAQVPELTALLKDVKPNLVINVALPYHDLTIMDACLAATSALGRPVHYLDTANYEHPDTAKFCYAPQWAYQEKFEKAGVTALLGCGFDPGHTNVYTAYLRKHYFERLDTVDILDCNAGDHGYPFATNFNPEINIREVSAKGRYYEDGKWIETEPLSVKKIFNFPKIGEKDMYLLYHEEMESLIKHFPEIKRMRFWMTFGQSYLTHLKVLENVGMTRIDSIEYEGHQIVPLQFLKRMLPDPASLGPRTNGKTNIGVLATGEPSKKRREIDGLNTAYIYNVCDHQECFAETGAQAVSYTTGVPAALGAKMILTEQWKGAGVFNIEQFDPDPFMNEAGLWGLPWEITFPAATV